MQNQFPDHAPTSAQACNGGEQRVLLRVRCGMRKAAACLLLCLGLSSVVWAQAFQNLDFEEANVSNLPPRQFEFVSVEDGLPGWSAYVGTNQLTQVGHNAISLGAANVGVLGPQNAFVPLQGNYSAILQAGEVAGNPGAPASIEQTGLIPSSAKSVRFEGTLQLQEVGAVFTNSLFVTVGGQNVPVVPLGSDLYGCDVSVFAGSTENLEFTMSGAFGNALILLDAITFSPQAIPEPSALCLLAVGIAGVGIWRLTRRKPA